MLTTFTTTFTTTFITTSIITTTILSVMAVPGGGSSGYTDTMCGATFTDRCPQLSKGGSICVTECNV